MREYPLSGLFMLADRNLRNRPARTIAVAATFAVIAASLFSAQYLMSGARQSLDNGLNRMGADLMIVPAEYATSGEDALLTGRPTTFFFQDGGFETIADIPGVARASPELFIGTLYGQACCAGPIQLIAIDPAHDFTISSWLKENPSVIMGKDDIIVGSAIAGDIGSDLRFYGHTFHIAGRLDRTGLSGVDMAVFTRIEDAYTMADESGIKAARKLSIPKGMVSAVLVRVSPGSDPQTVSGEIMNRVPGTKAISRAGLSGTVSERLKTTASLLYGSALVVTAVTIPLLGCVAVLIASERRRETAILRGLGASQSFVRNLFITESVLLTLAGACTGIGTAALFLVAFGDFIAISLKIPFTMPPAGSILTSMGVALCLPVISGIIATLYPAVQVSRADPYTVIREAGI